MEIVMPKLGLTMEEGTLTRWLVADGARVPAGQLIREINRFLDLGAGGVLCPFVNTADEARALVAACHYPPVGTRSWGPRRAAGYGVEDGDYATLARDGLICLAMIETAEAVANVEEIAAAEGLTGIGVGPIDLS